MTSSLFLLFAWLLLLCGQVKMRPQTGSEPDTVAQSLFPDPTTISMMKEYKAEVIKSAIRNAMNSQAPDPYENSLNHLFEKEGRGFTSGDTWIAYPLNDDITCQNEVHCARYEFELSPDSKSASSMHLWVHKEMQALPIEVTACLSTSLDEEQACEHVEKLVEVRSEKGWSAFELPHKFVMEHRKDSLFCVVEMSGPAMHINGDQKPFLLAKLKPVASERKRRSTNDKNCTCCLGDVPASFSFPGLVYPTEINIRMCYGMCKYPFLSQPVRYPKLENDDINNKTTSVEIEDLWINRCGPKTFKPLYVIYVSNSTGVEIMNQHMITDMIIESCGCY